MATELDGVVLAAALRDRLRESVDRLVASGVRPGLATIHAGADPAAAK